MNETMDSTNIEQAVNNAVIDETNKTTGKAVFALRSYVITDNKAIPDGYLFFKNIDNALELVNICFKELTESQGPSKKYSRNKTIAFYTPYKWVNINDFFAGQVMSKGTFFVRNLENCCADIIQDEILNEDKSHAIFNLNYDVVN